jgi:hypothetical protein
MPNVGPPPQSGTPSLDRFLQPTIQILRSNRLPPAKSALAPTWDLAHEAHGGSPGESPPPLARSLESPDIDERTRIPNCRPGLPCV